jgi:hypothetical protein
MKEGESEENTGVEAPGTCMEPMCGSAITLDDKEYRNSCILIEVGANGFAYKYTKQDRIFVGVCEFCNNRNVLRVECVCGRVKYCSDSCLEKDKRFHLPSCAAQKDK